MPAPGDCHAAGRVIGGAGDASNNELPYSARISAQSLGDAARVRLILAVA